MKTSATIVGRQRKILKLDWLKRSKTVPGKRNLDQKINGTKPHIWSSSINFRFSGIKPTKTSKKDHSFYNTVTLKNLTHFTNLNSLNMIKNILLRYSQKRYSLYKFSSKHDSGWCQKKTFLLHHF